jgi:hypothetical protein
MPTGGLNKQTMAWSLTERLHAATGSNELLSPDHLVDQFDNNMRGLLMPPTPPSHGKFQFFYHGNLEFT